MPFAPLLQHFVDDELARTPQLIEQVRSLAAERLLHAGTRDALAPHDVRLRHHAGQALNVHADSFTLQYVEALRTLAQGDLAGPDRPAHAQSASDGEGPAGSLALMDESLVESDIEISRATMLIDSVVEWEQRELQAFTSALRGEAHVGTDSNPLRPALVARALWQATGVLAMPAAQRVLVLREAAGAIGSPLKQAYAAACSRIEAQGVEPSHFRTVLLVAGHAADSGSPGSRQPVADATRPGALRGLLAAMPGGTTAAAPSTPPAAPAEATLVQLEALLRRAGSTPLASVGVGDGPAAGKENVGLPGGGAGIGRSVLAGSAPQGIDGRLIELLSRLFDAILADPALPAPAKAALARLQVSVLRVALRDPTLLDSLDHPTWRLMDRIANACQQVAAGPVRLSALGSACVGLSDDLARHAGPDAALYRHALARLDAVLADDLHQAQQAAQAAIAALQRTDRRLRIQAQVQARLEEQFVLSPAGPAVRRMLLGPWAQMLAEAILQSGPECEATAALTRSVDDLLWSLHPPAHPASRQRLVKLLPGLLGRLRAGMAQCGLAEGERQAVLDELEASHTATLWPGGTAAGPGSTGGAETPQDIVRRLREEGDDALAPRYDFGNSVLDIPSLETVPADLLPEDAATGRGDDRARHTLAAVAALAAGHAVRLLLQGRWIDAQLLWRSEGGELLLFVDGSGRTHALTRRALERLHAERLAHLEPPGSLVRRAAEGLLASLS